MATTVTVSIPGGRRLKQSETSEIGRYLMICSKCDSPDESLLNVWLCWSDLPYISHPVIFVLCEYIAPSPAPALHGFRMHQAYLKLTYNGQLLNFVKIC